MILTPRYFFDHVARLGSSVSQRIFKIVNDWIVDWLLTTHRCCVLDRTGSSIIAANIVFFSSWLFEQSLWWKFLKATENSCRQSNIEAINFFDNTHYESNVFNSDCAIMIEICFKSNKFCYALKYVVLVPCRRKPLPRKEAIDVD